MNALGGGCAVGTHYGGKSHACNCVGCCKACGTCRTAPWHTADYCAMVARQNAERASWGVK